ncbi:hypothetical protein [Psychromonas sp. CNPT3]|nr:hypothetical protein [Psychromonas sp. CNPT3]
MERRVVSVLETLFDHAWRSQYALLKITETPQVMNAINASNPNPR